MAVNIKKDLYKYKLHPYYEKPNKKERALLQRVIRRYLKLAINNGI